MPAEAPTTEHWIRRLVPIVWMVVNFSLLILIAVTDVPAWIVVVWVAVTIVPVVRLRHQSADADG